MTISEAVRSLDRDLREMFGARLRSVVAYGHAPDGDAALSALAVVDSVTSDDLRACAARVAAWHDAGLDTPLILAADEFGRSLDAFPFEFGAIIADHAVVSGDNPFEGLRVEPADLRRACEVQARSHLLHLREGYVETRGRGDEVAALIQRSAAPLGALLTSVARLIGGGSHEPRAAARAIELALTLEDEPLTQVVGLSLGKRPLTSDEARRAFPAYLDAVHRLTRYIDHWTAT